MPSVMHQRRARAYTIGMKQLASAIVRHTAIWSNSFLEAFIVMETGECYWSQLHYILVK
jgi:hypothetical protein